MKNKKLVAILALTGAIANLGLATVFAAANPTGSQAISCEENAGAPTFDAPAAVGFDPRTTAFHSDTDAGANAGATLRVEDNEVMGCITTGFTISIASEGLTATADGQDYSIMLKTMAGAAGNWSQANLTGMTETFPGTLLGGVATAGPAAEEEDIVILGGVNILTTTAGFTGALEADIGQNFLVASHENFGKRTEETGAWVSADYTYNSTLPADTYEGTIVVALNQ